MREGEKEGARKRAMRGRGLVHEIGERLGAQGRADRRVRGRGLVSERGQMRKRGLARERPGVGARKRAVAWEREGAGGCVREARTG